jgi:hypothetical protein
MNVTAQCARRSRGSDQASLFVRDRSISLQDSSPEPSRADVRVSASTVFRPVENPCRPLGNPYRRALFLVPTADAGNDAVQTRGFHCIRLARENGGRSKVDVRGALNSRDQRAQRFIRQIQQLVGMFERKSMTMTLHKKLREGTPALLDCPNGVP